VRRLSATLLLVVVGAACGAGGPRSAADIQSCVKKRLPAGAVDRVVTSTEEGVASVNYFRNGSEVDMSVFQSEADAIAAEKAEARLGDAHDRRLKNVLYSGGGVIEAAIVRCIT
jgi:hypothetical protein